MGISEIRALIVVENAAARLDLSKLYYIENGILSRHLAVNLALGAKFLNSAFTLCRSQMAAAQGIPDPLVQGEGVQSPRPVGEG